MPDIKTEKSLDYNYDPEADVMYVSFGTGEPSFADEVNDIFILERGVFSKMPTGFRILNFKKHKVRGVVIDIKRELKSTVKHEESQFLRYFKERTKQLQQGVESTLEKV